MPELGFMREHRPGVPEALIASSWHFQRHSLTEWTICHVNTGLVFVRDPAPPHYDIQLVRGVGHDGLSLSTEQFWSIAYAALAACGAFERKRGLRCEAAFLRFGLSLFIDKAPSLPRFAWDEAEPAFDFVTQAKLAVRKL
jgi:hypothetical protein